MVRLGLVGLGVVSALAVSVAPALGESPHPWQSGAGGGDVVIPAGEVCSFELAEHVVADKERFRVAETYPDGSTRREEWTGELVLELTNTSTGESVTRNVTGRGDFVYGQDGSWSLVDVGGAFAAGLHTGSSDQPGMYVVRGHDWSVTQSASGWRTLSVGSGTVENLCETLG
jgi:hypothetical protein